MCYNNIGDSMTYIIIFLLSFLVSYNLFLLIDYLLMRLKLNKISTNKLFLTLLLGVIFLLFYYFYGISYKFYGSIILSLFFVQVCITDFNHFIILDSSLIITGVFFLVLKVFYFGWQSILISFGFGILTFSFFYLLQAVSKKVLKKESLGFGDVKLAFLIGFIFDLPYLFVIIFLSAFLALPYTYAATKLFHVKQVPFGPFLAGSLLLLFLFIEKFQYVIVLFQ